MTRPSIGNIFAGILIAVLLSAVGLLVARISIQTQLAHRPPEQALAPAPDEPAVDTTAGRP